MAHAAMPFVTGLVQNISGAVAGRKQSKTWTSQSRQTKFKKAGRAKAVDKSNNFLQELSNMVCHVTGLVQNISQAVAERKQS